MQWKDHLRELEKMRDSTRPSHLRSETRQRYAQGGSVRQRMKRLAAQGRYGDTQLAEIGERTYHLLDELIHGGRKQINPRTGLREYPPPVPGAAPAPAPAAAGAPVPVPAALPHIRQIGGGGMDYPTGCGVAAGYGNLHKLRKITPQQHPQSQAGAFQYFDQDVAPYLQLQAKEAAKRKNKKNKSLAEYRKYPKNVQLRADPDLSQMGETVFPSHVMEPKGQKLEQFRSKISPIITPAGRYEKMGENENISPTRLKEALDDGRAVSMVGRIARTNPQEDHALNLERLEQQPAAAPAPAPPPAWRARISDPMAPAIAEYDYNYRQDNPFGMELPGSQVDQINSYYYSKPITEPDALYEPEYSQQEIDDLYNPQGLSPADLQKQRRDVIKAAKKYPDDFPTPPAGWTQGKKWPS